MTGSTETPSPAERRAAALRRAAKAKQHDAEQRAGAAIRELLRTRQEITFRSVARAGAVSLDFLYAHTELRHRIESLRAQQGPRTPATEPVAADADGNVVQALTARLREERTSRRAAVSDLEQRLASAHGEILRLRRALDQHGIKI
jgi:hypothetical protein